MSRLEELALFMMRGKAGKEGSGSSGAPTTGDHGSCFSLSCLIRSKEKLTNELSTGTEEREVAQKGHALIIRRANDEIETANVGRKVPVSSSVGGDETGGALRTKTVSGKKVGERWGKALPSSRRRPSSTPSGRWQ